MQLTELAYKSWAKLLELDRAFADIGWLPDREIETGLR